MARAFARRPKAEFVVPTRALATAIAAEWQAQREHIDPESMPLTRLPTPPSTALPREQAEVGAEIVKYLGSDLVCYRAADPSELVRRQAEAWDPVLDWCQAALGIKLAVTTGIMPVAQPAAAGAALAEWLRAARCLRAGGRACHDDAVGLGGVDGGACRGPSRLRRSLGGGPYR